MTTKEIQGESRRGIKWAGVTLFFLMMFAPTVLQPVKAALILILGFMIISEATRTNILGISRDILVIILVYVFVGTAFVLLGVIRGHEGATAVFRVVAVYPMIYALFISGIRDTKWIEKTMVLTCIAISLYGIQFVLSQFGFPGFTLGLGESFSLHGFSFASLNTLLFLVPYCVATYDKPYRKIAIFLGVLVALVSGRRGLLLAVLLSVVLTLGWRALTGRTFLKPALLTGGIVASLFLVIDPSQLFEMFRSALDPDYSYDAAIRSQQARDLYAAFLEHPIMGSGFGADLGAMRGEAITEDANNWSYELQYLQLLANVGMLGVAVYAVGILWIYRFCPNTPILIAMTCFLVANATNPYLLKFDFLWTIFLPIAYVNTEIVQEVLREPV